MGSPRTTISAMTVKPGATVRVTLIAIKEAMQGLPKMLLGIA